VREASQLFSDDLLEDVAIERQVRGLATQDRVARGEKLGAISGATGKVLGAS